MSDPLKEVIAVIRPTKPGQVAEARIYGPVLENGRRKLRHVLYFSHYGAARQYAVDRE